MTLRGPARCSQAPQVLGLCGQTGWSLSPITHLLVGQPLIRLLGLPEAKAGSIPCREKQALYKGGGQGGGTTCPSDTWMDTSYYGWSTGPVNCPHLPAEAPEGLKYTSMTLPQGSGRSRNGRRQCWFPPSPCDAAPKGHGDLPWAEVAGCLSATTSLCLIPWVSHTFQKLRSTTMPASGRAANGRYRVRAKRWLKVRKS